MFLTFPSAFDPHHEKNCLWHFKTDGSPGPEVIKTFSCSTQLSMNFILLINVKMPTIVVGILTFISRIKTRFDDVSLKAKCRLFRYV